MRIIIHMQFEWDDKKNSANLAKHNLSFYEAQTAFKDEHRIIFQDKKHSVREVRYFCIGKTAAGGIATVRFTIRSGNIRIIGAGYWRQGRKKYERQR